MKDVKDTAVYEEIERLKMIIKQRQERPKSKRNTSKTFIWSDNSSDDEEEEDYFQQGENSADCYRCRFDQDFTELYGLSYGDSQKVLIEKMMKDSRTVGKPLLEENEHIMHEMTVAELKKIRNTRETKRVAYMKALKKECDEVLENLARKKSVNTNQNKKYIPFVILHNDTLMRI